MKVVVTGGSGLVGRYLQQYLQAEYLSSKDYDLTKESAVLSMFLEHNPDVVVHLAAKVGGIVDNIQYPFEYYEKNILMNIHQNFLEYLQFKYQNLHPDLV